MTSETTRFERVFTGLRDLGSEAYRKVYARHRAGDNQFGVGLAALRGLAKKLKGDHALALTLWATGNADARLLAAMIMVPERLTEAEVEAMIKPLTYAKLVDELTFGVVARTSFAEALRLRWMSAPEEFVGRAGWNLTIARVLADDAKGLDVDGLLERIEAEILAAPKKMQESVNRCLVEIGVRLPAYTTRCLNIGTRLGRFDDTPVPKGCTSSYAPEWIAAALKRKR